jgi:hypothetical protein
MKWKRQEHSGQYARTSPRMEAQMALNAVVYLDRTIDTFSSITEGIPTVLKRYIEQCRDMI